MMRFGQAPPGRLLLYVLVAHGFGPIWWAAAMLATAGSEESCRSMCHGWAEIRVV
jgi:hypothetical protein